MCYSKCTQLKLEVHSIGVIDFGEFYCMDCMGSFTRTALKYALKARFGEMWPHKLAELNQLKLNVKRGVRRGRKRGFRMAETIYFVDPPEMAELHEGHINWPNEHTKPGDGEAIDNTSYAGRVYYLRGLGNHG